MARNPDDTSTEIRDIRSKEQSRAGAARESGKENQRRLKLFSGLAIKAIEASDERAFAEALRTANVGEGSAEWMAAWKFYRAHRP